MKKPLPNRAAYEAWLTRVSTIFNEPRIQEFTVPSVTDAELARVHDELDLIAEPDGCDVEDDRFEIISIEAIPAAAAR